MLLRVKFCETVHSHATQQNAKELSASRALLHPLKIAVIRNSPASRQTAWCWASFVLTKATPGYAGGEKELIARGGVDKKKSPS